MYSCWKEPELGWNRATENCAPPELGWLLMTSKAPGVSGSHHIEWNSSYRASGRVSIQLAGIQRLQQDTVCTRRLTGVWTTLFVFSLRSVTTRALCPKMTMVIP